MSQILNFQSNYKGLSSEEAEERLTMYGYNTDGEQEENTYSLKKSIVSIRFFSQIIAVVLLFLTEQYVMGSVMLLLCIMLTAGDFIMQIKLSEKEASLKKLSGMKFRAVRNNELSLVRKEYLVPDDIIVLQKGERVPADAHLLETENLTVNESVLTGSSEPVLKRTGSEDGKTIPKSTCIYKNTLIVSGSLVARVFATGEDVALKRQENRSVSRFEKRIKSPMKTIILMGAAFAVLTALFCFFKAEALDGLNDIITKIALPALSVGMLFVPAQADRLVRLYYLLGAERMNRRHALVKNISTVEELSAITCVCIEKTGTVTKNHIEVADVFTENEKLFTNVCVLACQPTPVDPMEKAILLHSTFGGTDVKDLFSNEREAVYPFSESTNMAGNLWNIGGQRLLCIKGSPEEILALCSIDSNELHYIQQKRLGFAKQGRQVLAVAYAALSPQQTNPEKISDIRYEYIGLVALENITRDTVPYAVKSCTKAGVKVIMITGDNEETAAAVGRQIGLPSVKTIVGSELDFDPDLDDVGIFAKVNSSQRLKVIEMLRARGEIVAVVGTGADDISLLEEADVGISVSSNASPAACESCDMLMSDDNFLAVAEAVKESRQIHRNVKSALGLMLAGHLAASLFVIAVIATANLAVFTPILAVLLSCVLYPAAASMFIGNTADLKSDFTSSTFIASGIINGSFFLKIFILGGMLAVSEILFYLFTLHFEPILQRSFFFFMMTAGLIFIGLSLVSRKRSFFSCAREQKGFSGALQLGVMLLFCLIVMYVPYLNAAFGFSAPNVLVLFVSLIVTALFTFWPEVAKRFNSV